MNIEEFREKVKKMAGERGIVWVTADLKYTEESKETISFLLDLLVECEQCGKCCSGFWFKIVPLFIGEPEKLIRVSGKTPEEFSNIVVQADLDGVHAVCISQPCGFLNSENKCSIYKDRPAVCKMFPITVTDKIRINVSCPAGFNAYVKMASRGYFTLDSENL